MGNSLDPRQRNVVQAVIDQVETESGLTLGQRTLGRAEPSYGIGGSIRATLIDEGVTSRRRSGIFSLLHF